MGGNPAGRTERTAGKHQRERKGNFAGTQRKNTGFIRPVNRKPVPQDRRRRIAAVTHKGGFGRKPAAVLAKQQHCEQSAFLLRPGVRAGSARKTGKDVPNAQQGIG